MSARKSNKSRPDPFGKHKKNILLGSVVAAVLTTAAVGVALLLPPGVPNPAKQTAGQRTAYMASEFFSRLDTDAKRAYLDQARKLGGGIRPWQGGLDEEQRRNLRENMRSVMEQRMEERMEEFFKLPPDQRDKYLDRILDQRMGRGQMGGRGGRQQPSAQRLQRRIERTNPQAYARQLAFREALQKRAQQRGTNFQ
jgi:hypothetical protein